MNKKIFLFGLGIDRTDMNDALRVSLEALENHRRTVIYTPNLEMLNECNRNRDLKRLINSGDLLLPDGTGLMLVSKILGKGTIKPVAGIDFGHSLLTLAAKHGEKVFLLGGKPGVAERAAFNLKNEIPGLDICGVGDGYFGSYDEERRIIEKIRSSGAAILLVCMGFPKQEFWVAKRCAEIPDVSVFACLGGSLDVWAGDIPRAPRLLRSIHAEWLWRIACEPERIPRFLHSTRIIFSSICQRVKNNTAVTKISVLKGK